MKYYTGGDAKLREQPRRQKIRKNQYIYTPNKGQTKEQGILYFCSYQLSSIWKEDLKQI